MVLFVFHLIQRQIMSISYYNKTVGHPERPFSKHLHNSHLVHWVRDSCHVREHAMLTRSTDLVDFCTQTASINLYNLPVTILSYPYWLHLVSFLALYTLRSIVLTFSKRPSILWTFITLWKRQLHVSSPIYVWNNNSSCPHILALASEAISTLVSDPRHMLQKVTCQKWCYTKRQSPQLIENPIQCIVKVLQWQSREYSVHHNTPAILVHCYQYVHHQQRRFDLDHCSLFVRFDTGDKTYSIQFMTPKTICQIFTMAKILELFFGEVFVRLTPALTSSQVSLLSLRMVET